MNVAAVVTVGIVTALYAALIAYEATHFATARDQIRHQVRTRWLTAPHATTSRLSIAAAVIVAAVGSTGCLTGERPTLAEERVTTGDPAVDDVLARLDAAGRATFTADYALLARFGDLRTSAIVVQDGPARRSVTIGTIRFIMDGATAATCHLDIGGCSDTIDAALVSNTQVTPGLLREQRGGPAAPGRRLARRGDDGIGRDDRRPAGDVRRGAGGEWRVDLHLGVERDARRKRWPRYVWGFVAFAVATGVAALMDPFFEPANQVAVYLLAVTLVATRLGRGPSVMVALLSVLAFDFFSCRRGGRWPSTIRNIS